ncbi:MAG TPA: hypothetical protein VIG64_06980 [Actinomycetota bacterium]|jgi:hypothetical protein
MRRLAPVALALLLIASILAPPAAAAKETATDPNDTGGRLDIVELSFKGEAGGTNTIKLKTQNPWGCKFLRQGVKTSLNWHFDDGEDGDNDLVGKFVCVNANSNDPELVLKLHGTDSNNNYDPVPTKRPDKKTVKVTFPFDIGEFESEHASAHARSKDAISEGCDVCVDRAPDTGGLTLY